ncbi:cyanophycinase [candidate division KSB1 bacterium]|nr:cyanophycinase [candidate division KSB1 bacterium]
MSKRVGMILILICLYWTSGLFAGQKGYLIIVGGGEKPGLALEQFVTLSRQGTILVITSASGVPEESGPDMVQQLLTAGARQVQWRHIDSPAMANTDSVVQRIESATGIFFTGGIQARLMDRIGGTRAEAAIRALYFDKGGVIGGTSAGAAVMSQVMITGEELVHKDTTATFISIQSRNIETKRGFGFLDQVIIDQHFVVRKRHNRLMSVVLENPKLRGVGIDEDTAILVAPDGKCQVYGDGSVLVYDARKARSIQINAQGLLGGENIRLDVYMAGDTFSIK